MAYLLLFTHSNFISMPTVQYIFNFWIHTFRKLEVKHDLDFLSQGHHMLISLESVIIFNISDPNIQKYI